MNSKSVAVISALIFLSLLFELHIVVRKAQAQDMPVSQAYEDLKVLITEIEVDINLAEEGNEAAGKRVRNKMQEIKLAAQRVGCSTLKTQSEPAASAERTSPKG